MAHNIDFTTGKAAIAFRGSRDAIWHRHGQAFQPGWTMDDWRKQAGLDWECMKVPALADLSGLSVSLPSAQRWSSMVDKLVVVDGHKFLARSDTGGILGHCSDRYQPVQPKDLFDWFGQYVGVDDRFQLDVAGALKGGAIIWATATYNGGMDVAGDQHVARLLMTTTFDGTGATINKATMTRVVCNNTLSAALGCNDKGAAPIRTAHRAKFDKARVGAELATMISQFNRYKAMGEAMAARHIKPEDMSRLFKHVLDIPFDTTKKEDISANKRKQFEELQAAYSITKDERNGEGMTMWTGLQAVARFADHNRPVRGNGTADGEKRFLTANFEGAGMRMKQQAVEFLTELSDGDLLKAVQAPTPHRDGDDGLKDLLAATPIYRN